MVPEAYWDECADAIRDYCKLINKSDIEREVANFRARQYEMLAQLKTAPGEGGGTAQSTRSKRTKEGGAAEDRPPDDAGEVSIGARSKRIASFVKFGYNITNRPRALEPSFLLFNNKRIWG